MSEQHFQLEYQHNNSTYGLDIYANDFDGAKKVVESIKSSVTLAGRIGETIQCNAAQNALLSKQYARTETEKPSD